MGKYIKLTEEFMTQTRRDFEEALRLAKLSDGKFNFTKTFAKPGKDHAKVFFTPSAWVKMLLLLGNFDKEVAWHGVATRFGDEENDEYMISDILVYPQEVTGATVNTDQEEYQMWLMQQPDEVFNNIRMQGHSHVNMGTSPSSVDIEHQNRILEQLDDDMFYIFMIYNKRLEFFVKIFDLKKNTVFEKDEITVTIRDGERDFSAFLADAKAKVKDRVYQAPAAQNWKNQPGTYTKPAEAAKPAETALPPKPQPQEEKKIEKLDGRYQYSRPSRDYYGYQDYYGGFYD